MSEAASKLTVKVKLHPPALPAETDTPVVQPAPWSKTRIALASLVLVGAGVAGYQFLLRPVAPLKSAVAAEPEQAVAPALQPSVPASVQPSVQPTTQLSVQPTAEQAVTAAAPSVTATTQPAVETAATPAASLPQPEVVAQSKPAVTATPGTAAATQNSASQPVQVATLSATPDKVSAATDTPESRPALPAGFSRIVLTDQMNNLQPGQAVGQQIPYPRINRLYLFTELTGYAGQILRHRWYFGDTLHTDAVLTIEDSPWRTYSENWLLDDQRGPWRVEIVDQTQKVIFQYSFTYQ